MADRTIRIRRPFALISGLILVSIGVAALLHELADVGFGIVVAIALLVGGSAATAALIVSTRRTASSAPV